MTTRKNICAASMTRSAKSLMTSLVAIVWLAGCGFSDGTPEDFCDLRLSVGDSSNGSFVVGTTVTATASADVQGFLSTSWTVVDELGEPIPCTDDFDGLCVGTSVSFVPAVAGPHLVQVTGSIDGRSCSASSRTINVREPGANDGIYRMVVQPADGGPSFSKLQLVPGGANFFAGEQTLPTGIDVTGVVTRDGGQVAAHLRVVGQDGDGVDVFSSAEAGYAARIAIGPLDVDVIPSDSSLAPFRLGNVSLSDVSDIVIGDGDAVSGTVASPSLAGLDGSRVVLRTSGLPSSVGVSVGAGAFQTRIASAITMNEISVTPPSDSGLPVVSGAIDPVAGGDVVDVTYAANLVTRTIDFAVTEVDGITPINNARVEFVSDALDQAATASPGDTALVGRVRRVVQTGAGGQTGPVSLLEGDYTVVVSSPSEGMPTVIRRRIEAGADPVLSLTPPSLWRVALTDSSGVPLTGARVSFLPLGPLGLARGATRTAISTAEGNVDANLVAGGDYDVVVEAGAGAGSNFGRFRLGPVAAGGPGELTDAGQQIIPRGQTVRGQVVLESGGSAKGAHVSFYCVDCETPLASIAEGATDDAGEWEITLPDTGVSAALAE